MRRLLVADSGEHFVDAVCVALQDEYELTSCRQGTQVPGLVRMFQPDILILDLQLPGMDGLSILEDIHNAGYRPVVLALTRLHTDYVQKSLERLGISYAMVKPCNIGCVVRRIRDMAQQYLDENADVENERSRAERLMLALGFRPSLTGYRCMLEAICLIAADPEMALSKQVYPAVAKLLGSTVAQVEHAIRLTVTDAWKHHEEAVWASYFPKDENGTIRRPTNSVLLTRLAAAIRKHS